MAISRRGLMKAAGAGSAAVVAGTLGAGTEPEGAEAYEQRVRQYLKENLLLSQATRKPVVLPAPGSMDPAEHARADVLFWSDQLAEHALFIAMFLPGDELAQLRQQALAFQRQFMEHLATVQRATIDRENFQRLNRQTLDLVLPLIDFKVRVEDAQRRGQVRSLVYPSFAAHIRAEAERFTGRLDQLSRGDATLDLGELVQFWMRIMEEHATFAAHLLDPEEAALIEQARATAANFRALRTSGADIITLFTAAETIIHFKETTGAGIEAAQIQSIIHPALADHILREAIKFRDELQRASGLPGGGKGK